MRIDWVHNGTDTRTATDHTTHADAVAMAQAVGADPDDIQRVTLWDGRVVFHVWAVCDGRWITV